MADRVHPRESSSHDRQPQTPSPPTGTYLVQIPKDQIYRVPPPENTHRYQNYTHRKNRRNPCCCCLCWILSIIILLIILIAISATIFYFLVKPKIPNYSVDNLSIKGINLDSSSDLTLSPEFDVTVRAENPNNRIGIYYVKGSSVVVSYSDINFCSGELPVFYQPTNNVTVFQMALIGSNVKLTTVNYEDLLGQQKNGKIPIELDLKVPVKIKVGSIKTWKIIVKVKCEIIVNKLASDSEIVSRDCGVNVKPW